MTNSFLDTSLQIKSARMGGIRTVIEIALLVLVSLVYLLSVVTTGLLYGEHTGLLGDLSVPSASQKLYTSFTPSAPVYLMWVLVFAWNGAWIAYAWSFVCRQNKARTMHELVYFFFAVAVCLNVVWNFLWSYLSVAAAMGLITAVLALLYVCIVLVAFPLYRNAAKLRLEQRRDLWATRVLTLNGLALYSTWVEALWLVNLASAMVYEGGVSNEAAALTALSLLLALFLVYYVVEQTFLDRFARHIVVDFVIYPWTVVWIVVAQTDAVLLPSQTVSGYTVAVLVLSLLVLLAKVALNVVYMFTRPMKYPELDMESVTQDPTSTDQ